jgi:hypothetical protein
MAKRIMVLAGLMVWVAACADDSKPPLRPPDAGPIVPDGNASFLELCVADTDCASGHCILIGGAKRCSRLCDTSTPCPAYTGWSCNAHAYCECTLSTVQPDVCYVDGDCDGEPDKPLKAETCNGEDDDCNGQIDDVAPNTAGAKRYYKDADGDGWGDLSHERWLCQPEAGWVETKDDCDDTRKEDNPGATEICGDNYDNDCDGVKEDYDVCGLTPIVVPDVTGSYTSASLKTCSTTAGLDKSLDITEILGKQDAHAIKFTVRLAGSPATTTCTSYTLHLGDPSKSTYDLVYIYRPGITACGSIPSVEAYLKGQPLTSSVVTGFNAADPGHVSFILEKAEIFPELPSPTYKLRACANATADLVLDKTACVDDSCEVPVHR